MRREIEARDRWKTKVKGIFIFMLLFVLGKHVLAQNPNPNCDANVPYFFVNMTLSPSGTWSSTPVTRNGYCCGASGSDACVAFDILLNPNTAGIQIDMTGANPGGSLFYQIGCGNSFPGGTVKCISGAGPHHITLCKPGGNSNVYIITAVSVPLFPADDTIRIGCKQKLISYGVANSSVTWQSIYPGTPGQYNSYLDSTNVASPTYSAAANAPPYVEYKVCGTPLATMCGYTATVCDTVRIYNFQPLANLFNPSPAAFCNVGPGSGVSISATPAGGQAPYQYIWTNSTGTVGTNSSYFATAAGTYSVEIRDMLYNSASCPSLKQTISVIQGTLPAVDAGLNTTTCSASPAVNLNGSVQFAPGGIWSGGTGSFAPNNTSLNPNYTPSAAELTAGFTKLYLTSNLTGGGCPNKKDSVLIYYSTLNANTSVTSNYNGLNVSCPGSSNGSASVNVTGGTAAYTYNWNTVPAQTSQTATGLSAGTWAVTITDANNCSTTTSVTLVDPTPVNANAIVSQTVHCLGGTNGAASVTASGGAGGYSYSWNTTPVQTSAMAVGLPVGAYNVTVTDANGCSTQATVALDPGIILNTATAIVSNYNGQQISCAGASNGSASVNVSGGAGPYTYSWNTTPVQTSATATNLGAGTYVVTIADINNCLATASVTIVDPSPMNITSAITSQSVDCNGYSTGSAAVSPVGGVPGYTYSWSTTPAQTSANALNLSAGNYNVTVTDANGCIATASVAVIEPSPINIVISDISNYNGFNTKCNGDATGSVDITVTGGIGSYIYQWSNGAYTEDLSSISAGAYNVVVTDANGCVNTITFPVTQPGPIVVALDSLSQYNLFNVSCNGSSDGSIFVAVSGGANNYTYNWSNGETTKDITNLTAGYYSLGITDQNGCKGKIRVSLNEPDPILLSTTSTMPDCNGMHNGSINVSSAGGISPYHYTWSNGAIGQTNTNIGAGVYTVTTTDKNGCATTEVITLNQPDKLAIAHGIKDNKCFSDSTGEVTSTVNGGTLPYTYMWSTGSTAKDLTNIPAGIYSVNVTDAHGCNIQNTVIITQPDSLHVTLSSPVLLNGHNISLHNGTDGSIGVNVQGGINPYYFWWSNSSSSADQYNLNAGTYNVVCADANGCKTMAKIALSQPSVLEMPTGFSPNSDGANDLFVVHGIEAYPSNFLTIYNRWGNIVFSKAMYNNDWNGSNFDGQALPDGTYFALLEINGREIVLKGYVEIRK